MLIDFRESAKKDLRKIDKSKISMLLKRIQELEQYPNTPNIKKLKNYSPTHRMRIGDYRILFDIEDEYIVIAKIKHRKEAY